MTHDIRDIRSDRNLGYILGCTLGDCHIWQPTKRNKAIKLITTNESFAKYFYKILKRVTGVEPRFYERVYQTKKTPSRIYQNVKFYETTLYSVGFVRFLVSTFNLKKKKLGQEISMNQFMNYGRRFCIGFLQGIFDSDGSIYFGKIKGRTKPIISIALYSSSENILTSIIELLKDFDFSPTRLLTYVNNSGYKAHRVILCRLGDIIKFHKLIGFNVDYKNQKLLDAVKIIGS